MGRRVTELNYYIACQLSQCVRDILAVIDYMKTDQISQALGRLDSTHKEQTESRSGFANNKANTSVRLEVGAQPYQRPSINHINSCITVEQFSRVCSCWSKNYKSHARSLSNYKYLEVQS